MDTDNPLFVIGKYTKSCNTGEWIIIGLEPIIGRVMSKYYDLLKINN